MNVSLIRKLAPGQMPRASEWNALVDYVQRLEQRDSSKFHAETLPRTRFYTAEEIPPYSLFPVLERVEEESADTFRTVYHVEKYDSSHESSYLEGYFGVNGKYTIPKDSYFYGHIIDETHDWPIRIETSDPSMTKCGFLPGSFIADPDANGLIVGGTTPFGPDIFFVRKAQQVGESEPEAVVCEVLDEDESGVYSVLTYANGPHDPHTGYAKLLVLGLALGSKVPAGTFLIGHKSALEALNVEEVENG